MLKCFKQTNGKISEISIDGISKNCWIDCTEPTDSELKTLSKITDIPLGELKLCLDEEERPRIDFGKDYCLIIYRAPYVKKEEDEIEVLTSPIGIFVKKNFVVTVHLHHTKYLEDILERGKSGEFLWQNPSRFLLRTLSSITERYMLALKRIEDEIEKVEERDIDHIFHNPDRDIMSTKKTLTFFHRSLLADRVVLISIIEKKNPFIDQSLVESFGDLNVETLQLIDTSIIYKDVIFAIQEYHRSRMYGSMHNWMRAMAITMFIFFIAAASAVLLKLI
ncbi:MAG: CorA family divalent cation transporter [Candidatus Aenigmatarchaeota archaeon]